MTGICPCCGYNLSADKAVSVDQWRIEPRGGAFYRGKRVVGRPATWVQILLSLAREQGRCLSTPALLARISESENDNVLGTQICKLRRHLANQGVPDPIESVWNVGYRWRRAA